MSAARSRLARTGRDGTYDDARDDAAPDGGARDAGGPRRGAGPGAGTGSRPVPGVDDHEVDDEAASWPPGVSRTPTMAIGQVVAVLQEEFPAMTLSKLRYLEEQDLVRPHRSPSGYRKYSRADVERLRFTLAAQRDAFLPLRVIRDQLDDLDAGRGVQDPTLARLVARDGQVVAPSATARLTSRELANATGASLSDIAALVEAGLVPVDSRGRHAGSCVPAVVAATALGRHGVDPRHLRTVRQAAEREAGTVSAVLAPLRAGRSGADLERANATAREMGELYAQLHTELLRRAIAET